MLDNLTTRHSKHLWEPRHQAMLCINGQSNSKWRCGKGKNNHFDRIENMSQWFREETMSRRATQVTTIHQDYGDLTNRLHPIQTVIRRRDCHTRRVEAQINTHCQHPRQRRAQSHSGECGAQWATLCSRRNAQSHNREQAQWVTLCSRRNSFQKKES